MKKKELFGFGRNWKYIFQELSDEQAGILIKAIADYVETEIFEPSDEVLRVAFAAMKADLDYDIAWQNHISLVRSEAGRKGGLQSGMKRSKHSPKRKPAVIHKFKAPVLAEVQEFITSHKYAVDAEKFINYYESVGWKVGNKPMKDWKSAVTYWNTSAKKKKKELDLTSDNNEYLKSFKPAAV